MKNIKVKKKKTKNQDRTLLGHSSSHQSLKLLISSFSLLGLVYKAIAHSVIKPRHLPHCGKLETLSIFLPAASGAPTHCMHSPRRAGAAVLTLSSSQPWAAEQTGQERELSTTSLPSLAKLSPDFMEERGVTNPSIWLQQLGQAKWMQSFQPQFLEAASGGWGAPRETFDPSQRIST